MNAATTKSGGKSSEITPLTRRRIVAELDRISLSGELPEIEFLKKVWPIDTIPSPHPGGRERTMEDYLVRHRIANHDMSNREVLEALGINTCPQEKIFRLLEQVLDPLIREFPQQMELASRLNCHLNLDGFSLEKTGSMSGSPIFNVQPVRPVGSGTMRVSDKLVLIDKIGRALQAKFTYSEIDAFLQEFEIPLPEKAGTNSKWVYSKSALQGVPEDILLKIAQELDLEIPRSQRTVAGPPRNWMGATHFRLFISHISKDKDNAIRLKDCLAPYAISGFVAHEDIHPTLEWQNEIERALFAMDAFIAIHTPGFSASVWTQQEIGVAVGRGIKIISFKMGEDPTGFISKHQALSRGKRTAEQIAKEIDALLQADELTASKLLAAKTASGLTNEIPF